MQAYKEGTGVAERESPSEPRELHERCCRQSSQFPRNHSAEEQENRDEVTVAKVEAVIGPIEALYVEHRPLEYGERLVDAPGRIGFTKTERVANGEQQDQNRRDAVKNRCAHSEFGFAPTSIPELRARLSTFWSEVKLAHITLAGRADGEQRAAVAARVLEGAERLRV